MVYVRGGDARGAGLPGGEDIRMLSLLTINRIDTVSAGKLFGIACAVVLGIPLGFFYGAFVAFGATIGPSGTRGPASVLVGAAVLFFAPIVMGIQGFIGGVLMGVVYNMSVKRFGGVVLEVEVENEDDDARA